MAKPQPHSQAKLPTAPQGPYRQPDLDDNMTRAMTEPFLNAFKAYGIVQGEDGRWVAVQVFLDKSGKTTNIKIHGHTEVEREFAENQMIKTIAFEERIRI